MPRVSEGNVRYRANAMSKRAHDNISAHQCGMCLMVGHGAWETDKCPKQGGGASTTTTTGGGGRGNGKGRGKGTGNGQGKGKNQKGGE